MTDANTVLICAVYDSAVKEYMQPFFQKTCAEAIRSFKLACNNKDHNFNQYAGDYALFVIGEFKSDNGQLVNYENADNLGKAIEHIDNEPAPGQMNLVEPLAKS